MKIMIFMTENKIKVQKLVVVINGKGGVGKDSLCDAMESAYSVKNISAITPIKEIAAQYGWHGEKDEKARRFLSELKRVFVNYNDLPNRYLVDEYIEFLKSNRQILFVHIREIDQIEHFVSCVHTPCITLLIRRKAVDELRQYGNESDDNVALYPYDYYFDNDMPYEESGKAFIKFFDALWSEIFS